MLISEMCFKNTTAAHFFYGINNRETQFLDRYLADYYQKQDKEKERNATVLLFWYSFCYDASQSA